MPYTKTKAVKQVRHERALEVQKSRQGLTDEQQLERIKLRQKRKADKGESKREIARLTERIERKTRVKAVVAGAVKVCDEVIAPQKKRAKDRRADEKKAG
jgi:hypothetical protein